MAHVGAIDTSIGALRFTIGSYLSAAQLLPSALIQEEQLMDGENGGAHMPSALPVVGERFKNRDAVTVCRRFRDGGHRLRFCDHLQKRSHAPVPKRQPEPRRCTFAGGRRIRNRRPARPGAVRLTKQSPNGRSGSAARAGPGTRTGPALSACPGYFCLKTRLRDRLSRCEPATTMSR